VAQQAAAPAERRARRSAQPAFVATAAAAVAVAVERQAPPVRRKLRREMLRARVVSPAAATGGTEKSKRPRYRDIERARRSPHG